MRSPYPSQGDEDDPAPLPSWCPPPSAHEALPPTAPSRRERLLVWGLLALGIAGVVLGFVEAGAVTEVILGALVVVLTLRVLFARRSAPQSSVLRR